MSIDPPTPHRWGTAAFAHARETRQPLLLCITRGPRAAHDLAHPPGFVVVRIDRDEQPALDRLCQLAHQLLTQSPGGWPLFVFFDASTELPFFSVAGTDAHGLPPASLLARIRAFHDAEPDTLAAQHAALRAAFADLRPPPASTATFDDAPLRAARQTLAAAFDFEHGGFVTTPKFVRPWLLERLLRDWRRSATGSTPDLQALYMVTMTLTRLAKSPMCTSSGAFHDHSTQADWSSPNASLTLGDNGALLALYAQTALATGEPEFTIVTRRLATALLRDWRLPDGAFATAFHGAARDDRALPIGNSQAIRGLVWAARTLRDAQFTDAAATALAALQQRYGAALPWSTTAGQAAGLEEHAALADAVLELLQQRWDPALHQFFESLLTMLRTEFEDPEAGGYFDLAPRHTQPKSFHDLKTFGDETMPAGNALLARVLRRSAAWSGDQTRDVSADRILALAWPALVRQPQAHATLLGVLEETLVRPEVLVLRGAGTEIENALLDLQRVYAPMRLVFAISDTER
ncbi:MAG: thioredoxin domain-containing protein [Gammaproteobacteria bacterium]|nr:thioredoxin domain-containing protein [Gammaproteobacteria bacterium]